VFAGTAVTDLDCHVATAFRWNIARREQLGALVPRNNAPVDPWLLRELRTACARVLEAAGDSLLVFIGRSPESLFDYLSGILADTEWAERCVLLNVSLRMRPDATIYRLAPEDVPAFLDQIRTVGLDPRTIIERGTPVALIDLIYTGYTFRNLLSLLADGATADDVSFREVRDRLRIIGLTERTKNSPNTWRWQQRTDWAQAFPRRQLKSVSLAPEFWQYLGGGQPKVTPSNPPWRWGTPSRAVPRDAEHLTALQAAVALHDAARGRAERDAFVAELAQQQVGLRAPWLRRVALQIRGR
jgi:hypothetical protein